jgi:hypothetical protein
VVVRFAKIALAAVLLALFELAVGWRVSVLGACPDLLFVLVAFAAARLRPGEDVPVACAVGLLSDFLLGGRLGLQALGYAGGARAAGWLRAVLGRSGAEGKGGVLVRAGGVFLTTLAGAAAAHGTVAVLGALVGGGTGASAFGWRAGRAAAIAFLTGAAAPVAWPVLSVSLGELRADFSMGREA